MEKLMNKAQRRLIKNALDGNFEETMLVFLNYKYGLNGFEKNEILAKDNFDKAVQTITSEIFLSELTVANYKKIKESKICLHKNLTVFIGENGVGKTSFLNAIQKNLSWIIAHILKKNNNGERITEDEINNQAKENYEVACINCKFKLGLENEFDGQLVLGPRGATTDLKSEYMKYRSIGKYIRELNDFESINLPLFISYSIERLKKDTNKTSKTSEDSIFFKFNGYERSSQLKTMFKEIIDWIVQLLKLSKNVEKIAERVKVQSQIDKLLATGANDKNHDLYDLYSDLISVLNSHPTQDVNLKAKKSIECLELLFRNIYPNLIRLLLINEDDGNDKVGFQLENEIIFLDQFSDGQRVLFGLIGDLARRLILLNDNSDEPLQGHGIVLIDEIELHLHPRWQQKVILILRNSFPNLQFIVTTHSPHVITTVEPECIRSIYIDAETKKFKYDVPTFTKGAESNVVLENVFDVDPRPEWLIDSTEWLKRYTDLVNSDLWDSDEAVNLREKLDAWGKNKETELDRLDIEISLRAFKRSKK